MIEMNKKVSKNFIYKEICGGKEENFPSEDNLINAMLTTQNILQPVREKFGIVIVTSFQRNPKYNKKIGGSKTSDHQFGKAVDFKIKGFDKSQMEEVFIWMKHNLEFKQLIFENRNGAIWIHCSFDLEDNKKQTLSAKYDTNKNKMVYREVL